MQNCWIGDYNGFEKSTDGTYVRRIVLSGVLCISKNGEGINGKGCTS